MVFWKYCPTWKYCIEACNVFAWIVFIWVGESSGIFSGIFPALETGSPCKDDGNKKGEERKERDGDSRGRRSGTQPPPKIAKTSQGDVSGSGSGYRHHQSSQRPPSNTGRQRIEQVKAEIGKSDEQLVQQETKIQASI